MCVGGESGVESKGILAMTSVSGVGLRRHEASFLYEYEMTVGQNKKGAKSKAIYIYIYRGSREQRGNITKDGMVRSKAMKSVGMGWNGFRGSYGRALSSGVTALLALLAQWPPAEKETRKDNRYEWHRLRVSGHQRSFGKRNEAMELCIALDRQKSTNGSRSILPAAAARAVPPAPQSIPHFCIGCLS